MRNTITATAFSAAILTGSLVAAPTVVAETSANIAATSNYVWRGASQTGNNSAVQGGMDYASDSGVYVGTWASNVNFGDANTDGEYELDGYVGWATDFNDNVSLDVGYVYYYYGLTNSGADFGEVYANVGFSLFEVAAYYTVNDDKEGDASDTDPFAAGDLFVQGSVSVPLAEGWDIAFTIGQYMFENDGVDDVDLDYTWGQIDMTRSVEEFGDITLSASKADEEADGNDDVKVFITWAKSF